MDELSSHHRGRGQGAETSACGDVRPGQAGRSLFVSSRFDSLRKDTDIVDECGEVVYHSTSRPISLKDKTDVTDARGAQVAHIERRVLTLHEHHRVEMADGRTFDVTCDIPQLATDAVDIRELGWQLRGHIAALDFEIQDEEKGVVAVVGHEGVPSADLHRADILRGDLEAEVVAILVVLQHTMRDREAAPAAHATPGSRQA